MKRLALSVLLLFALLAPAVRGQERRPRRNRPRDVVAGAVKAAEQLQATLDESQRKALLFPFDDDTQRGRWSNLPSGIFPRKGLRMGDLTDAQRDAVFQLLKATLSERGVQQVVENMDADEVLKEQGGGRGRPQFGRAEFFISILGKPSATEPWMWQFGGHHLAINATLAADRITLSPASPAGSR